MTPTRIGLVGFGYVGRHVYERLQAAGDPRLQVAFVHARDPARLAALPPEIRLDDLSRAADRDAGLIVEMAHPDVTRRWGAAFLRTASYLPLSVAALADDALRASLLAAATEHGTSIAIPHGALMGLDSLHEWREHWADVTITFRKSPDNIDFAASGVDRSSIRAETVLYDGPVRGIAALYPRNVNTMVTCALATVGLDRCRARLIAVPGLPVAIAEVQARGHDGAVLEMRKSQPVVGVSGTEMLASQYASVLRACGVRGTMAFV